ncbi:MAG: multidrug efflux protein [Alphaproteobacteria bacterium 41-28]|nr:MAG: multidrug efflux protein [Alphaproteobacteria bacterium 41-28]
MKFTDLYIHKPVLATVVSLMILVLGLRSIDLLPIRQFPFTQNAIVTVLTTYTGADPELIASFITTPLEQSIAQASGIDYLTSSSNQNASIIQANLRLNYDSQKALSDINTKVNAVLNLLPKDSQIPVITVVVGDVIDAMYIGFYSNILPSNKITDYLLRVVQPKLQAIPDVQVAEILGGRQFAMRAWLDPVKMSALGVTPSDISNALVSNNFISAVGRTNGQMVTVNFKSTTGLESEDAFRNLIVKAENGAIVRLQDVGTVSLGAENYDTAVKFDGKEAVYIGIKVTPTANLLTVVENVRKLFPTIQAQLPEGLKGEIVYDSTKYVNASIHEVIASLTEAIAIVIFVIFLFLASPRIIIIPIVAIPLSIIGTFFIMLLLGYSINLLTLLALVLSIGLVVDDAIIVVENVYRHIEGGMKPVDASILGARELANPIIAITVVLIAVYVPIGFMGGLTGALFTEFAFTLAGAVAISAIIALTLSPMMCSKFLKKTTPSRFSVFVDHQFRRLETGYEKALNLSLNSLPVVGVFSVIVFFSIGFLYVGSKTELAPQEDQGVILGLLTAAPNATLGQTQLYARQVYEAYSSFPETDHSFQLDGASSPGVSGLNLSFTGMVLKPWSERKHTAIQLQSKVQELISQIPGAKIALFSPPPLPGAGQGLPMQFVIQTTEPFGVLNEVAQTIMGKAYESGLFAYLDSDLKIDKVQATLELDRDKASLLGLDMKALGDLLQSALSQNYVNFFNFYGRSYKVIPQVARAERINFDQPLNYYLKTALGTTVPLSTVTKYKTKVVPQSLNHFQQLNSATISGVPAPGITQGEALQMMQKIAKETLPQGFSVDYGGESRQYIQEGSSLVVTFFFAIVIIFLALAALFESFRDPLIVLISVPMSICGAMIFICLGVGGASLNIYTQVGLVTLIGLISKHGILIVQFANDLQKEGKDKREAIAMAAGIRLRPILMTSAAMVLGVVPLITATGAGAVSRYSIGLVIASGISIGTLFTLFVVPAMYMFLAEKMSPEKS